MIKDFEQVSVGGTAVTVSSLTIPATATHAELQADTENIRYRGDSTAPTAAVGSVLVALAAPKLFLIEDIKTMQFIAVQNTAKLNIHYYG